MGGRLAQAFGRLTSSFGGPSPLRGGAGLSGGIGRGFDGAGSGRAPAGAGGGKLGGLSRQLTPTRTKTAVLPKTTSAFKGANLRRLDQMNKAIKPTAGQGNLQNAAQVQTDQWSSGQAQGSIGGAGAGQGQSPSAAGADSIGGPDDGGPIGVGPGAGGGTGGTTTTDIPDTGAGQDVTPWNGMVMMAQMMLMLASIAIMFIGILTLLGDAYPTFKAAIDGIKSMIFMLATGLAGIAAVLGIMIATSYGQATQGAILSVGGAITTACALIAYMQPGAMSTSTAAWMAVIGGIAGLAASIGGALAGRV